ncbi:molybdopterin-binding protein [Clostridium beijerinckii]|uniref:molybdopterin-binding protein n=1 Tax=Clostridium beijerinckii TaxID=1520 RepID=UPI000809BB15|nr:molybdopterin-binding protein [Clostridium beijerinckii]OCA98692.1 molybdopterin-binding protein [Clostridium beijerinckii]
MKLVTTVDAEGYTICHDMTQIIPDIIKDVRFKKGHIIQKEDIPILLSMGKENIYVWEKDDAVYHEDEAAKVLRDFFIGNNMHSTTPKEGKIEFISDIDGLFTVDIPRLNKINDIDEIILSTRYTNTWIHKDDKLAATKIIPLFIKKTKLEYLGEIYENGKPIIDVKPFVLKTAGLIITGNEIKKGVIEDKFSSVIKEKLACYGIEVREIVYPGDDADAITQSALQMKEAGIELIICTGGMSVDPDDRTPGAIKNTGANIISYGAPVLPGAMFLLGYFDDGTPIMGLPGGVVVSKVSVVDLVLPRIAARISISRKDLKTLGHGGLCSCL